MPRITGPTETTLSRDPDWERNEVVTQSPRVSQSGRPLVHPRWVWTGTAGGVLGVCGAGLGLMLSSPLLVWVSAAVLVLGLVIAWRGGVLHDVRAQQPLDQAIKDVEEGNVHEGLSSEAVVVGQTAQRTAAEVTVRKRELIQERTAAPVPSLSPVGVMALLVLAGWLLVGQWVLVYPFSVTGQNSALRDLGLAVVIALSALWLRQVGPSTVALALCGLAGVLLVVAGLAAPHDAVRVQWNEILSGCLVLVAVALARSAPARRH